MNSTSDRILIAGVGNIFLGDDAFGVEVAQRLLQCSLPDGVRVVDFGIRGLDLTYALLDRYEAVILVDAAPRGEPPGTLYVIEPKLDTAAEVVPGHLMLETHSLDPAKVLRLAAALGGTVPRVLLVGCEPQRLGDEFNPALGLSEVVEAAVGPAVELIQALLSKIVASGRAAGGTSLDSEPEPGPAYEVQT